MRVPKSITIQGKRWQVSYKWNLLDDDGEHVDGLCDTKMRMIYIDRATSKKQRSSIFLHETLHAVIYESKVDRVLDDKVEEILVESLEEFLMERFTMRLKNG